MYYILFIFNIVLGLLNISNPNTGQLDIRNGDLIFQESVSGSTVDDAIKGVTSSIDGYNFTHVGIVWINNLDTVVIEATPPRVQITPLNVYLTRKPQRSVVGRLKSEYQFLIPLAIDEGLKLIGKDYDFAFNLDNDKYYCSELIYYIFLRANNNTPVFILNSMTFKDNTTNKIKAEWINYYKKLNEPVPEGKLGINPGAMSRSGVIDIIFEIIE